VTDEAALTSLPTTRRALLVALKRLGECQARELADELGVSVPAVRPHLRRLEEDGLVTHEREGSRRGRPAHNYRLTSDGEALFPKRYGDLTAELLGYLGGPQSPEVGRLFEQRGRRRLDDAVLRLADLTLDEQVAELTSILDEDGYLADVERLDGGGWRIVEHNCAILAVASSYRQACSSELAFIRAALPGARVERVAHLIEAGHVCAYEVWPLDGPDVTLPPSRQG
jgi:DeoR family transcriptional regulator, suf operon transcriptional repressor